MRTKEEKRIANNIAQKKHRDKLRGGPPRVEKTKEEKRIANNISAQKHYAENKELRLANQKKWNAKNKEANKAQKKEYAKSLKLPYFIIYALPSHFYCGVTNQPDLRMANHRSQHGRTTSNYLIMATAETRAEALEIEAEFHDAGWNGKQCYT